MAVWFVVLTILCGWHSVARAEETPFLPADEGWQGLTQLIALCRDQLGSDRVLVRADVDWGELQPTDALMVLHPQTDLDPLEFEAFLREGGRAVLLDDFGVGDEILSRYGIHRTGPPVHPARVLRGNSQLAIALPTELPASHAPHPLVAQVDAVVTNHPTGLTNPGLTPLLGIPNRSAPDTPLALLGVVDAGRLVAVADPSVFINQMLRYPGNRQFAKSLAGYLLEREGTAGATGRLFIASNRFGQTGIYHGRKGLLDSLRLALQQLRKSFDELDSKGLSPPLALALAVVLSGGVLLWAARRVRQVHRTAPPRFASAVPLVALGGVAGRAAVLAAPTTHRALVALELKSALVESLADALGVSPTTTTEQLMTQAREQRLVSSTLLANLQMAWPELARVEQRVRAAQRLRVPASHIVTWQSLLQQLRLELESGESPEPLGVSTTRHRP